jgi:hypothetical protein
MPDLITQARATQNATLSALNATNPPYLTSLITTASDSIRQYCRRDFTQTNYVEYQSGGIYKGEAIRLRQWPVTNISRVAANPVAALLVQNNGTIAQRATVQTVASTDNLSTASILLSEMDSGVPSSASILTTTYPTLGTLAAAISAVSGWTCTVYGNIANIDITKYPSADLRILQGAVSAIGPGSYLEIYSEDIYPWGLGVGGGYGSWSWGGDFAGGYGWRLKSETGELFGIFPCGQSNLRIDYTAGYAVIPQPVQEACVQMIQDLYQASLINSNVSMAKIGTYTYETKSTATAGMVSGKVQQLLAQYVDFSRVIFDS